MPIPPEPEHLNRLTSNLGEVERLVQLHKEIAGDSPGRKFKVQVLNKAGVVLLVATWEGVIEDLAKLAFEAILEKCDDPKLLPDRLKSIIGHTLKQDASPLTVWKVSGNGWKEVLKAHGNSILSKQLEYFHVPRPDNIDALFHDLIGLRNISSNWKWHGGSNKTLKKNLNALIDLRGDIAHSNSEGRSVLKRDVHGGAKLIIRLAAVTHNSIVKFLRDHYRIATWTDVKPHKGFDEKWK